MALKRLDDLTAAQQQVLMDARRSGQPWHVWQELAVAFDLCPRSSTTPSAAVAWNLADRLLSRERRRLAIVSKPLNAEQAQRIADGLTFAQSIGADLLSSLHSLTKPDPAGSQL